MADTKRAAAHRRPGPERGVAAYRRTPEREQTIFYLNHLLPLYHKLGYLNLYGPLTVSDLFFDFFVEIFGVF